MKKLSQWAAEKNIKYKDAWTQSKNGTLPVKTHLSKTGRIYVMEEAKASLESNNGKFATPSVISGNKTMFESNASRRNKAGTSLPTDEYFHISSGVVPFEVSNDSGSNISIGEAIRLCQKCYWNFSIFRNTIDLMTEFSTNKIYLRNGNSRSRQFITNWLDSINYLDLQDKFFREYYRSSNVFIKRFESKLRPENIKELSKAFSVESTAAVSLPIRYIILNPADITVQGNISFTSPVFCKILNGYELAKLKNPSTDEEKRFLKSLPEDTRQKIKSGINSISIPLDMSQVFAIFYKKQDYEPLSVPMGYPVLKDINWKSEMKHIDMAVARVMNNVVLLVKMGYESRNGEYMFDVQAANAMRQLFESESVGKTLVADFTTDIEHKIPQIGDFLDPKKYTIVNDDIKTGLNHILSGGGESKFANQFIQTQIFIQRLQQAREAFLTQFLIPEIRRISDMMNFKSYPKPYFEDFDLKDPAEFNRTVTRLAEIGLLTPEETFEAIESGRLPTGEESALSQESFRELKDKGYYEPIIGGPFTQKEIVTETNKNQTKLQQSQQDHDDKQSTKQRKHDAANPKPQAPSINIVSPKEMKSIPGRPSGDKRKQSTKKISPSKASVSDTEEYSLSKVKDNTILAMELKNIINKKLCEKYNQDDLTEEQVSSAESIREVIMYSESPDDWKNNVDNYIDNPTFKNESIAIEIDKIAAYHSLDRFLAAILYASRKE